jgi:hypothetical protein
MIMQHIYTTSQTWFKVRYHNDGVKGKNHPHGKNYGFICTCITGSTEFPKLLIFFWILSAYATDSRSNNIRKKISFECSLAYQLIQDLLLISHRTTS